MTDLFAQTEGEIVGGVPVPMSAVFGIGPDGVFFGGGIPVFVARVVDLVGDASGIGSGVAARGIGWIEDDEADFDAAP